MKATARTNKPPIILWFRQDLRLADNPALTAALASGAPLIPIYILETNRDVTPLGGAQHWWLHHSLMALIADMKKCGSELILRRGDAAAELKKLVKETGATAVYVNRCYEPGAVKRDTKLKDDLTHHNIVWHSSNGSLLFEPWELKTKQGGSFKVFTPFWRALQASDNSITAPLPAPRKLPAVPPHIKSDDLQNWQLLPTKPDWATGFADTWQPGEATAKHTLAEFLDDKLSHYANGRNQPALEVTARLSPHLHWGEVSPRTVWYAAQHKMHGNHSVQGNAAKFLSELAWREFNYMLLYYNPDLPDKPYNKKYENFEWQKNKALLTAWQRGQTGYPIVDAGMRQLWTSGWMHNRVRLITASFLVKNLLQPWQDGADWFLDCLVDADLANNSGNWQWVAGSGADAAPYFRIFNPVLQGKKFDAAGDYVRAWIPELTDIPKKFIHTPWEMEMPPANYPAPIVDLAESRDAALAAYRKLK